MASRSLINQMSRMFTSGTDEGGYNFPSTSILRNNELFNCFISINAVEGTIEVPTFLRALFASYLNSLRSSRNYFISEGHLEDFKPGAFIVPMYSVNSLTVKKTGDSILSFVFSARMQDKLLRFKIPGDESLYYGARGLLLNDNKEVLMVATTKFTIYEDFSFIISGGSIVVNPKVFVNKDLVSKTIISKVLPFYIENPLGVNFLIEDRNYFIQRVTPAEDNFQEDLELILKENLDFLSTDFDLRYEGYF